jgi:hypothetical protein
MSRSANEQASKGGKAQAASPRGVEALILHLAAVEAHAAGSSECA